MYRSASRYGISTSEFDRTVASNLHSNLDQSIFEISDAESRDHEIKSRHANDRRTVDDKPRPIDESRHRDEPRQSKESQSRDEYRLQYDEPQQVDELRLAKDSRSVDDKQQGNQHRLSEDLGPRVEGRYASDSGQVDERRSVEDRRHMDERRQLDERHSVVDNQHLYERRPVEDRRLFDEHRSVADSRYIDGDRSPDECLKEKDHLSREVYRQEDKLRSRDEYQHRQIHDQHQPELDTSIAYGVIDHQFLPPPKMKEYAGRKDRNYDRRTFARPESVTSQCSSHDDRYGHRTSQASEVQQPFRTSTPATTADSEVFASVQEYVNRKSSVPHTVSERSDSTHVQQSARMDEDRRLKYSSIVEQGNYNYTNESSTRESSQEDHSTQGFNSQHRRARENSEVEHASSGSKRYAPSETESDTEESSRPTKKPIFGSMWKLENFLGNANMEISRNGSKDVQACGDFFQDTFVKSKNSKDPIMKKEKSSFMPPYATKK
eukprot:TRINITY_DN3705_c0_g1_i12.p1 TRINITY_DN3705_c0_g1~~TRINITY_DN3705_c0_g1_i12.p1  ORF type:complete len:500 (-),score=33.06 TRINITY_DN3705_c0_g1_i12:373-1848(-)